MRGVGPQPQRHAGTADDLAGGPGECILEVPIDFEDHAVVTSGQQDGIGAQVEEGGKALFRVHQRSFPLALARDLAYHPNHLRPAVRVAGQAAIDLQPMQAAVWPANAVAHGPPYRFAIEHRLERLACSRAVLFGKQVQVIDVSGQGAQRVETEQGLGAPGPAYPAAFNIPKPRTQARTIQGGQQLRRTLPGLLRRLGVCRMDSRQAHEAVC